MTTQTDSPMGSAYISSPQEISMPTDNILSLRRWILGLVLVDFDLEHGPCVTDTKPEIELSSVERENIAFSAFPDSQQFDQGAHIHSFVLRSKIVKLGHQSSRTFSNDDFVYAHSYFSQKRDVSSKRGYQQQAIVILTHHAYTAFFHNLASKVGPLFISHGATILETAFYNIASWPDPSPGTTFEVGFLGSVMHVELPSSSNDQQLVETTSFRQPFNPALHILGASCPLYPPPILLFEASLTHLWSIWECVILCEPLLIFGTSPGMTSQAVWWLRDLIRPLPVSAHVRPYFTLQDSDCASLANPKQPPRGGCILGVTNPFFEKSCMHWPHLLSLGKPQSNSSPSPGKQGSMTGAGPKPGWTTKTHKRYTSKDKKLLELSQQSFQKDDEFKTEVSFALRRHFHTRTTALLAPLNRYLNSLIPTLSRSSPTLESSHGVLNDNYLRLKPFNTKDFLQSLSHSPSTILPFRSKSHRIRFYTRWLKSPVFGLWLVQQEEVVKSALAKATASPKIS